MKKTIIVCLLLTVVGSCVPLFTLEPFYNEKDVIKDDRILGCWVDDVNKPKKMWRFEKTQEDPNGYQFYYNDRESEDKDKKGSFIAHLVKLQDKYFIDVFPNKSIIEDPNVEWPYNSFFLIPTHTFIKVNSFEPDLKLSLSEAENFKKIVDADPNAVKYKEINDGWYLLTAPTKELQAFVVKHADGNSLFEKEIVLTRKKVSEPTEPNKPAVKEPNDPNKK
jgi:AAA15 family ATPase/GTPase